MKFDFSKLFIGVAIGFVAVSASYAAECAGERLAFARQQGLALADGGLAVWSKLNINIDGSARAYHPNNRAAGALIHLCNAGEVFLPDGTHYYGSESNNTCVGKFMQDFARIGEAGWNDPEIGAIRWFGILGKDSARIGPVTVQGVRPVSQPDGSGFFVSPTALFDPQYGEENQSRYIEPLTIPAAVVPSSAALRARGILLGTAGVAVRRDKGIAVPFVVGDIGPRVGEGTPALAHMLAGVPANPALSYAERFTGLVSDPSVLYVFFGGRQVIAPPYDAETVAGALHDAFEAWGGQQRLDVCLSEADVPTS